MTVYDKLPPETEKLERQKNLINNEDWDCLIILDACRYDYFEKNYEDFLEGDLQKVVSEGCWTEEWLNGTFEKGKHEDIVYVSGIPMVNSRGVKGVNGFDGNDYFHKVIDAYDKGWNEELKLIPPSPVGKAVRMSRARYPEKRLIAHFVQPHSPYIPLAPHESGMAGGVARNRGGSSLIKRLRRKIGRLAKKVIGPKRVTEIRKTLNLTSQGPSAIEQVAIEHGKDGLYQAYEENLRIALREVKKTANRLPGKIIITADHGELLGEEGAYGHPHFPHHTHPILREVPWFEVRK